MVGWMPSGGVCRRPGPSRRGFLGCEGINDGSISSPGRTKTVSDGILRWSVWAIARRVVWREGAGSSIGQRDSEMRFQRSSAY